MGRAVSVGGRQTVQQCPHRGDLGIALRAPERGQPAEALLQGGQTGPVRRHIGFQTGPLLGVRRRLAQLAQRLCRSRVPFFGVGVGVRKTPAQYGPEPVRLLGCQHLALGQSR